MRLRSGKIYVELTGGLLLDCSPTVIVSAAVNNINSDLVC